MECIHRLALDVFRRSRAGGSLWIDDSAGGRKSALANENGSPRSGHRCACQDQWSRGRRSSEASEIENSLATEEGHISELFTTFRRPLLLGIMLAGLQQISGITPLFSFLPEIFRSAGTATSDAFFQSVLVSLINLLFTLFALWLVDRAGRKTLILAGTALQFVSFAMVGWFYHIHGSGLAVLIFVMSFVAGHAFGNGVACWVIISEIYPTKVRGRGMSIATTALWLVGYLGNQLFPLMQKHLGSDGTFWCFSAGALLTIILVGWLIPETKGRSLEEITKFWTDEKVVVAR